MADIYFNPFKMSKINDVNEKYKHPTETDLKNNHKKSIIHPESYQKR